MPTLLQILLCVTLCGCQEEYLARQDAIILHQKKTSQCISTPYNIITSYVQKVQTWLQETLLGEIS